MILKESYAKLLPILFVNNVASNNLLNVAHRSSYFTLLTGIL